MRLLVTRPEPGASQTVERLRPLGHEAIALPLTEIVRVSEQTVPDTPVDAVAVTSANALRHARPRVVAALAGTVCHAVGDATAQAARTAGFTTVRSADGDVRALAHDLAEAAPPGATVAYLCGRVRRPCLEAALTERGLRIVAIETYDTLFVSYPTDVLDVLIDRGPVGGVLVYSALGAEALRRVMTQRPFRQHVENADLFCLSDRIGDAARPFWKGRIQSAVTPDEDALFAAIADANR